MVFIDCRWCGAGEGNHAGNCLSKLSPKGAAEVVKTLIKGADSEDEVRQILGKHYHLPTIDFFNFAPDPHKRFTVRMQYPGGLITVYI